jgi:hypothetical protein
MFFLDVMNVGKIRSDKLNGNIPTSLTLWEVEGIDSDQSITRCRFGEPDRLSIAKRVVKKANCNAQVSMSMRMVTVPGQSRKACQKVLPGNRVNILTIQFES